MLLQQVRDLGRYPKDQKTERSLAERQLAEKIRRARKAKQFSPEQEAELKALQQAERQADQKTEEAQQKDYLQQVRDLGHFPKENAGRSLAERQLAEEIRRARKARQFPPEKEAELKALQQAEQQAEQNTEVLMQAKASEGASAAAAKAAAADRVRGCSEGCGCGASRVPRPFWQNGRGCGNGAVRPWLRARLQRRLRLPIGCAAAAKAAAAAQVGCPGHFGKMGAAAVTVLSGRGCGRWQELAKGPFWQKRAAAVTLKTGRGCSGAGRAGEEERCPVSSVDWCLFKEGHVKVVCALSFLLLLLVPSGLRIAALGLRIALLSTAVTVQYEVANEPARQLELPDVAP